MDPKDGKLIIDLSEPVWYDAGGLGILFRAVVKELPRTFMDEFTVVGIGDLPQEYAEFSGRPPPSVSLALLKNVHKRNREDTRVQITWCEYLKDGSPGKIGHVVEVREEGPSSGRRGDDSTTTD